MKKLLLFALALLCVGAAFAQSKPRVAVYVTGKVDDGDKKVIASKLISAVTMSEEYLAVERMDEFLRELNKEHDYQRSGAVDVDRIIAVGKKWEANFVCIAEASKVYENTFVSARLIRVITGEVAASTERYKKVNGMADLDEIAESVAEKLFGVSFPKTTSSSKAEELPKTPASGKAADLQLGGITWAATNVDSYQTFAERPDMYTKFYQWNRNTAWAATGSVSRWEKGIRDRAWTINPCPAGWRLPTQEEYQALHNAGNTWAAAYTRGNAVNGRFYGVNHATASLPDNMEGSVFLPAVGYQNSSDGTLYSQGSYGYYWSWSAMQINASLGYRLSFSSTGSYPGNYGDKANGVSVRCVR